MGVQSLRVSTLTLWESRGLSGFGFRFKCMFVCRVWGFRVKGLASTRVCEGFRVHPLHLEGLSFRE